MNKYKVITAVTPDVMDYAKYHIASMGEYAGRHGYLYEVKSIPPSFLSRRSPHWAKVSAATWEQLHPTPGVEWLFVVDADTLVVDKSVKLESFDLGSCSIALCDDKPNGGCINTGAMFIRSGGMEDMLREWWDTGTELGLEFDKFHEQETLAYLMQQRVWKDSVKVFPATAFNSISDDLEQSKFIRHYMAMAVAKKAEAMRRDYKLLEGDE